MRKLMLIGPLAVVLSSLVLYAQQRGEKHEQLRDDLTLVGIGQVRVGEGAVQVLDGPSGATTACRSTYEAAQAEMERDRAPATFLTAAQQDEVTRLFAALANAKLWLGVKPNAPAVVSTFCSPELLRTIPVSLANLHARKLLMGAQERLAYQTADESRQVREDGGDLRKALLESGGGEPPR